jgi:hypothetical protein
MRLRDLFRPSTPKETASRVVTGDGEKSALINKQIRALVPGQTIQGEVTAKSGNEVQIKLAPEVVISARLSNDVNLDVGKPVLFQVKNNGSSLTLQPLFTNTATDVNVLKALEQANLPVNDTTAAMGEAMMKAGLSINKQALLQVFKEISQFPKSSPEDVVDLHRLGLPVTEENLSQVASYKNLTHQLTGGLEQLAKEIPLTIKGVVEGGESQKGLELLKAFVDMQMMDLPEGGIASPLGAADGGLLSHDAQGGNFQGLGQGSLQGSDALYQTGVLDGQLRTGETGTLLQTGVLDGQIRTGETGTLLQTGVSDGQLRTSEAGTLLQTGVLDGQFRAGETGTLLQAQGTDEQLLGQGVAASDILNREHPQGMGISDMQDTTNADTSQLRIGSVFRDIGNVSEQMISNFHQALADWEEGTVDAGKVLYELQQLLHAADGKPSESTRLLRSLLEDVRLNDFVKDTMLEQLALRPEAVKDKENIARLYDHWQRQMQTLSDTLEQNGLNGTALSKTVDNLNQNLNFLNQMNQVYQYVQIPLKMMENTAHGDLYVYTNKKNLAAAEGNISALLHLDMENLGPVDVYVSMEASKVNTHFYLQDDSLLDFMMAHIQVLNERLQAKGYDAKCEMTVKDAPGENPIENILAGQSQASVKPLVHQGFDVRA